MPDIPGCGAHLSAEKRTDSARIFWVRETSRVATEMSARETAKKLIQAPLLPLSLSLQHARRLRQRAEASAIMPVGSRLLVGAGALSGPAARFASGRALQPVATAAASSARSFTSSSSASSSSSSNRAHGLLSHQSSRATAPVLKTASESKPFSSASLAASPVPTAPARAQHVEYEPSATGLQQWAKWLPKVRIFLGILSKERGARVLKLT